MSTAAVVTLCVSILTAAGLLAERITGLVSARLAARKAAADPAATIAQAAATIAGSVEDIVGPLRAEIRELRAEVRALRETLDAHGIPAPEGPFTAS